MEGRVELDYKFPTGSKFIYFMLVHTSSKHNYTIIYIVDSMALPFFVQDNKCHSEVCRMIMHF